MAITENPFWVDHFSMGTRLSKELYFMHRGFPNEPFQEGYIYNIETGEVFNISMEEVTDKKDICVWPGGLWCYDNDKHHHSWENGNYAVYSIPAELSADEIEALINKGIIGDKI